MQKGGLVPSLPSDFSKSTYWESFFKKRVYAFEWYGTYYELCGILHRYIKTTDRILMAGCGNSELGDKMFDGGLESIVNIDISQTVIDQMISKKKKKGGRATLEYLKMDLTDLEFEDESFSVIVDKGTLDAIMSDNSAQSHETADKIFSEYHRVLKNGGRYICVTLVQDYILRKIMDYFPKNGWLVRLHRVSMSEEKSSNSLPVFAFVMTKLKNLPKKILEICPDDSFTQMRVENEEKIIDFVKSQQHYVALKVSLNKEVDPTKDNPPIQLFTAANTTYPRFVMNIIDKPTSKLHCRFAVFIVPQGRESNWLFGTNEGRRKVAEQTPFRRVLFVSLHPWHEYGTRADLQQELNSTVMDFAPPGTKPTDNIPYLSTNTEDLGQRFVMYKGESSMSGLHIVEDYTKEEGTWYRHLILMARQSIIQSEIRLKKDSSSLTTRKPIKQGKKKIDSEGKRIPDHTFLASGYAQPVLAGILLKFLPEEKFKALMVGVGGGALSTFIVHNFMNCHLTAIEIDPAMIKVAQEWFGLPKSMDEGQFKVHVEDGIKFVEDEEKRFDKDADTTEKYDIVMIDVDGQEYDQGISCPAIAFVELDYLKSLFHILKPDGLLMINLLCWKAEMRSKVMYNIRRIFKIVGKLSCEAYYNELVYCFKTKPNFKLPALTKSAKKRNRKKKGQKQDISPQKVDSNDNFNEKLVETEKCLNGVSIAPSSHQNDVKGHIDGDSKVKDSIHGDADVKSDSIHDNHIVKDCDHGSENSNKNNKIILIPENLSLKNENFIPPVDKKPIHLENYDSNLYKYWVERTKVWERESSIELSTLIETVSIEQDVDYYMMLK